MDKELVLEYFDDCVQLVKYVNHNHIERQSIQGIHQLNGDNWVLIYWE